MEVRLQSMIEGGLARLFGNQESFPTLARQVVEAMQSDIQISPDGLLYAPTRLMLHACPDIAALYRENPRLLDELAFQIQSAGEEAGLTFHTPLTIQVYAIQTYAPGEFTIQVDDQSQTGGSTAVLPATPTQRGSSIPASAYLIINGTQIFNLDQTVVNIGRHSENHIIIEDLRVSRQHAQIRANKGRYVLFDLQSRGGTFVNNQPVHQIVLKPGDVISLGGVFLVFGQDLPDEFGGTQEYTIDL